MIWKRFLATALIGSALASPNLAMAQDAPVNASLDLQPGTVIETFGPFRVERYFVDYRQRPILHAPLEVREARLLWSDSQGLVDLRLIDNGGIINLSISGTSDGGVRCIRPSVVVPPNFERSTNDNWLAFIPWIEREMDLCGLTDQEKRQAVLTEAESAFSFYGDAGNRWKAFVRDLFGENTRRCIALGDLVGGGGVMAYQPCTRWSDD